MKVETTVYAKRADKIAEVLVRAIDPTNPSDCNDRDERFLQANLANLVDIAA